MTAANVTTPIPQHNSEVAKRSLLVVDDEPVIRMIARTCLTAAGFVVADAGDEASAQEAIQKATKPFDLILLDLTLGETHGADLIPYFRSWSPTTRILVFSGLGSEEVEGLDVEGYLSKPFTKKSLLSAVSQALVRGNRGQESGDRKPKTSP